MSMSAIVQVHFNDIGIYLDNGIVSLSQVTGGSNGIGREICLELARCGCNVAILDVDLDAAHRVCNELRAIGVEANAYKVSVDLQNKIITYLIITSGRILFSL